MSKQDQTPKSSNEQGFFSALQSVFASSAIVIAIIIGIVIYKFVMGDPSHFEGGGLPGFDIEKAHAKKGDYLGIIYKGGFIVPILMAVIIILITFSIERLITIGKASGKGRLNVFVRQLSSLIGADKIEEAIAACDKQRGSLANVMKAGLTRYRTLQHDTTLANDQKVLALQKDLEEAAALELPMLSRNLVILSTLASISVLIGLIGTVLGMIRAFAALAQAGAPDALALANGISEALINTAFGISGSTVALIMYNYFSSKIDGLTFRIDEAGFSLSQTFAASLKR